MAEDAVPLAVIVGVLEGDPAAFLDGLVDGIDNVITAFIVRADTSIRMDVAREALRLLPAGRGENLLNQLTALPLRDEF